MKALSVGLPGRLKSSVTPFMYAQRSSSLLTNSGRFIPAIQREFVWNPEQICTLFDSLLQRFLVGSFLFWKSSKTAKSFRFFDFVGGDRAEDPDDVARL
jgi:hypothetical protein